MASHLGAYVCALYARNMSGEPKNEIGGRQYQTKPDQQEFSNKKTLTQATLQGDIKSRFLYRYILK